MSFVRYKNYRTSGIEWIGEIPNHWEVCALNYRYEVALGKMLDEKKITGKHLAPYLRNVDVQWSSINTDELPQMDFNDEDRCRYSLKVGDILVCEGGEVGRAAIWDARLSECYYQKALHRVRARDRSRDNASFLFFSLYAAAKLGVFAASESRATIFHLTAEALRRYRFPFPPLSEQRVIANFLTKETAKIDALIAEQERLIELLKEKRQAVISRAVTKGLRPGVQVKSSGVEWLGAVAAHWAVMPIRRCCEVVMTGTTPSPESFVTDQDVASLPWYTPGDFTNGVGASGANRSVSLAAAEVGNARRFPPGSVLFVGIGATLGKVAFSSEACSGNQQINAIVPKNGLDGKFLAYSLSVQSDVMRALSNASTIGIMNQEKTKDIPVAVPPLTEQTEITQFLDRELSSLASLVSECERAIELLGEHRSALISAAVTGQIDVRGLAGQKAA